MAITPLPTPPSRNDPANFPARADNFLGALPLFGAELNDAANAAVTAANSAVNAPGTSGTSTSQITIGTGSRGLIIQTGKAFVAGQFVLIANTADVSRWMNGQITAYNASTGAMTVAVATSSGSGGYSSWNVALSSPIDGSQYVRRDSALVTADAAAGTALDVIGRQADDGSFIRFISYSRSTLLGYAAFDPLVGMNLTALQGSVRITASANSVVYFRIGSTDKLALVGNEFKPTADNGLALGAPSMRFTQVYAAAGEINTSDARDKSWRGALDDNEIAAAREIAGAIGIYQWIAEVSAKGADNARLHCGVKAQQVASIFASHGLDPGRYGLYCYDSWAAAPATPGRAAIAAQPASHDDDGSVIRAAQPGVPAVEGTPAVAAGDRYGIRPDELLMFLVAAQEQRLRALEAA